MRDAHIKKKKKKRKKKSQIPPHQLYPITRTPRLIWSLYYQKTKLTNSRLEFISASPSPHQRCPLTLFSLFFFHPFGDDHQTSSLPPPSPSTELSFQTPTSPFVLSKSPLHPSFLLSTPNDGKIGQFHLESTDLN